MNRHLIVVSVDAMVYEDLELLRTLPNVGRLIADGSIVQKVTTIYPSLTHPVHATLMTGCPAGKTGIFNNTLFKPGEKSAPWFNSLNQLRCETIFHAAHRAGLTTAACRWPLTAGGFDQIDYLVPEIMDEDVAAEPNLEKLYRKACSPGLFDAILHRHTSLLDAPERHPAYEEFSMRCAADIIREYRPNLLMTHPGMVDHCRHVSGLFSPQVDEALRMTDRWIGLLMDAVRDAGIEDSTSFAIVSDHGHMEWVRAVALNVLFRQRGLLDIDADGQLVDWQIYAESSGLSCQIHVKDPAREAEFGQLLTELAKTGLYGFGEVLTRAECEAHYGLSGPFSFVLEGDGYTQFTSDCTGKLMRPFEPAGCGLHHSSHGHMPERGPQPPMILCGPAFARGITIERESILNEAPLFAAALGLTLPEACGTVPQPLAAAWR